MSLIIAVDFDNTLAMGNVDIHELTPNINLIEKLKKTNCYIKIVTARGSKNNLSPKEKHNRYYLSIKSWLEKYSVPYNEISFNKEYAHLYIDDMTIDENAYFSTFKNNFTKNDIIITEKSYIKKCNTSKSEFNWYKIANSHNILTPKVLFCNEELIITENIKNNRTPLVEEVLKVINKFKNIQYSNAKFETYLKNLAGYEIPYLPEHPSTFYHGDLSTKNILVSDEVYLIDPNFKNVFGSYITDAAKAAFSFFAFENDLESFKRICEVYPECKPFIIAEGLRVCKYRDFFPYIDQLYKILNLK